MLRSAPSAALALLLVACNDPPPPAPTKVTESKHLLADPPRAQPDPESPFRRPDRQPPKPRSEPQIPPAEIEAALSAANAALAAKEPFQATLALWPCANKVPQHVRCEGELAMLLADTPNRKAEARYYLEQAIATDDPGADADFYRRLGDALRRTSMWPEAIVAAERMIARTPEPRAEDFATLAELLSGVPQRELEAAQALQRAFELDPTQLDHLRDAGLLLAQLPDKRAEALGILTRYRDSVKTTEPDKAESVDRQIAELERDAAQAVAPTGGAGEAGAKARGKRRPKAG